MSHDDLFESDAATICQNRCAFAEVLEVSF